MGTGKAKNQSDFTELRIKASHKVDRIEAGVSSTGYISGGKVWIAGTIGDKVYDNFTTISCGGEEIVEFKLCDKNAIFLTKKGEVFQLG